MSRLYYEMKSNLYTSEDKYVTPYPDYFAFDYEEKRLHISVSCNGTHDWGCNKENVLNGRMKGLEVAITDYEGNEIHAYDEMTKEDFTLLLESKLYEVGMYFPTPSKYDDDFDAMLTDINIHIAFEDRDAIFKSKSTDVIAYGD